MSTVFFRSEGFDRFVDELPRLGTNPAQLLTLAPETHEPVKLLELS